RISLVCTILPDVRSLASSNIKGETMKRFVIALALGCIISGSAFAGDVPTGDNVPPPANAPTHITMAPAPIVVLAGGYTQDAVADITLMVVQGIIGLMSA